MELSVDGGRVLLTTHKTFCEAEELHSLQTLSHYAPLQTYLKACAERQALPSAVVVRQLDIVAHRIVSAVIDVVYQDSTTHTATTHALRLTNAQPAVFVPVVVMEGRRLGLLVREPTLSQGLAPVLAGMRGSVSATGAFVPAARHAAALQALGVDCAKAAAVSSQAFTIGTEGEPALRLFSATVTWTAENAETLPRWPTVVAVPLEDVLTAGDAAAALTISLLLRQE